VQSNFYNILKKIGNNQSAYILVCFYANLLKKLTLLLTL